MGTSLGQSFLFLGLLFVQKCSELSKIVYRLWKATKTAKEVMRHMFDNVNKKDHIQ